LGASLGNVRVCLEIIEGDAPTLLGVGASDLLIFLLILVAIQMSYGLWVWFR
jgi:hypothetical protein